MRKPLLAVVLLLAFASLPGCATIQSIIDAGKFATASVANPVTPTRLNEAEQALTVVFAAANAWKQACIRGAAETHCRENIATAQAYTRRMPPLLTQLRTFVRTNDQVNAILVYNQIKGLIDAFKSTAAASGVPVGGI